MINSDIFGIDLNEFKYMNSYIYLLTLSPCCLDISKTDIIGVCEIINYLEMKNEYHLFVYFIYWPEYCD